MKKLMILGAGYSGKAIARSASGLFDAMAGTTRSTGKFADLEEAGLTPLVFDSVTIAPELVAELSTVTHLVQSIAPGETGDQFLDLVPDLRNAMPNLAWIGYLSTVGVYGDHGGDWIDEDAELKPVSARSRERVRAEQAWQGRADASGVPLAILRLAGIYGPGRNGLVNLANGTARRLVKKDQVFNRIRVEDIGRACAFLIERNLGGIYNIADDEPAAPQDVVEFAAGLMGVSVPPDQPFETAELSPMARSFYGENKRVSNAKIRSLGFVFDHPDYRRSFEQLWNSGLWKG